MKSLLLILAAFRVAFLGDPQVDSEEQVRYARQAIREVRERGDIDLVVVLGDLVNDKTVFLEDIKASLDSLPCPWVSAPGNHDRDVYHVKGKVRDMVSFRKTIGYTDTTFVFKGTRFISMDDVRDGGDGYEGGFREDQKQWLDSVMRCTPKNMRTVISCHIPLSEFHAKDSLAAILRGHDRILAVCGHTHSVKRHTLELADDVRFEEVIAGTLCGSWWRGVKGEDGLPYGLMNCGAPRGWFIADFSNKRTNWYRLDYKCTGRDDRMSARVRDGMLVVNVYGGSLDGKLTLSTGGRTIEIPRRAMVAPEALEVSEWNASHDKEYKKQHKGEFIPILKWNSPHIWAISLDEIASGGDHGSSGSGSIDGGLLRYTDPAMTLSATLKQ
jgi:Predicted phosphohydrolases